MGIDDAPGRQGVPGTVTSSDVPLVSAGFWDTYWRGTHENAAHKEGGPQEPVLNAFWTDFFQRELAHRAQPLVLDLACGNGAVTGHARSVVPGLQVYCSDYSLSALRELQRRHPGCACLVADAARLPLAAGLFDVVVSQFGLEYAGEAALAEAARLLAPGGILALLIHVHDGGIYHECKLNRDALQELQALEVLPLAKAAFAAGFALNRGDCSPETFKGAERAFTPAVRGLEKLLRDRGPAAAGGLPQRLYQDIAHMYRRMSAYEPADILQWLEGMQGELLAYTGRMQSMLDAAWRKDQMDSASGQLATQGFRLLLCDQLTVPGHSLPAAWRLVLAKE